MHELSIALSILDIASEESARRGDASIKSIYVKLGPLSGVVREALLSAFALARECSPHGDCRLVIETAEVIVDCAACQAHRPVESIQLMRCQSCGTPSPNIISGREMEITAMEIVEPSARDCHCLAQPSGEET